MMIVVRTAIRFDGFDRFDPLLHLARKDLSLSHLGCGGPVVVSPRPYKRGVIGGLKPTPDHTHRLQCTRCGEATDPYERELIGRTLAHYLTGPDWETAPAQHLDEVVRFVPPDWPPRRRRMTDRRQSESRYSVDRSMEGQRRRTRDRRDDPSSVDAP